MKQLAANLRIGEGPLEETITDPVGFTFSSLGSVFSTLLVYIFTLAGFVLFVVFIWGGFDILTSSADPQKLKRGRERILYAIVGFVVIFAAYWIAQILEIILGIKILS